MFIFIYNLRTGTVGPAVSREEYIQNAAPLMMNGRIFFFADITTENI